MLGLPAVALPVGVADGLPQSVQLIGPRYREDLCLDAATALEDTLGTITPVDLIDPALLLQVVDGSKQKRGFELERELGVPAWVKAATLRTAIVSPSAVASSAPRRGRAGDR